MSDWQAIEQVRRGIGDDRFRLVPGTMSQEEADALASLALLEQLAEAAEQVANEQARFHPIAGYQFDIDVRKPLRVALAAVRAGTTGEAGE